MSCSSSDKVRLTGSDDAILDYSVPPLDEHYIEPIMDPEDPSIPFRSLLDLQPTPIFSERRIPPVWKCVSVMISGMVL